MIKYLVKEDVKPKGKAINKTYTVTKVTSVHNASKVNTVATMEAVDNTLTEGLPRNSRNRSFAAGRGENQEAED